MSVPDWLTPIVASLDSVGAEVLAPQFPHPPADARPAAVLMLFHETSDEPSILLTERTSTLRSHPGQISFPGGRSDDTDADAVHTALREAEEEVGLAPAAVNVLGNLPPLWLPPSNHAVTTVLGYWPHSHPLQARSPDEVESVLAVPIAELLDPARRFSVMHSSGWVGPAFDVGLSVPLWGFTAGVLARLFEYVGWERPWDASRVVDVSSFMREE
jgi:8-oxo-dGTP pyrophosphatase MutT (NUDIX family)